MVSSIPVLSNAKKLLDSFSMKMNNDLSEPFIKIHINGDQLSKRFLTYIVICIYKRRAVSKYLTRFYNYLFIT